MTARAEVPKTLVIRAKLFWLRAALVAQPSIPVAEGYRILGAHVDEPFVVRPEAN